MSLWPRPGTCYSAPKICSSAANSGGGHDEKEGPRPEGDGRHSSRGKLAERIEVEFGPFRPAASRRAECLLVALPTSWGLLLCAKHLFVAAMVASGGHKMMAGSDVTIAVRVPA